MVKRRFVLRAISIQTLCRWRKATVTLDQFPHPHCRRGRHIA
jgi:hypothetical protein